MNIAHLSRDGWVAVRFGDRLELIASDHCERMVAAGQIRLAARINRTAEAVDAASYGRILVTEGFRRQRLELSI
jgi:hypothetical protein